MRGAGSGDEFDDPISDLRYEPELTTRDVADFFRVTPAAVRQWVSRGYLRSTRQERSSNVFDTEEVFAAVNLIAANRKVTGNASRIDGYLAHSGPANRIPPKHYDAIVTISEAARLVQVSPTTIRSWIHRGHLTQVDGSTRRPVQLRVDDVVNAARARSLPQPVPGRRRGSRAR